MVSTWAPIEGKKPSPKPAGAAGGRFRVATDDDRH